MKKSHPLIKAEWTQTVIPDHFDTHKHYFEFNKEGKAQCVHCPFTLIGVLEIKDGKPIL